MSNQDSLGDRMKRYERVYRHALTPNMPVIIRVDGKAFHTWTRGLDRPFDVDLIASMAIATVRVSAELQGFKLAYVQSDEATFLITDTDSNEQEGWFGYDHTKIVSVSAALMTAHFNQAAQEMGIAAGRPPAIFDSRAFSVPWAEVPNQFLWRHKDWARNSVQMLARAYYSHSELTGRKLPEIHDMLHAKGVNWAKLSPQLKNGTFLRSDLFLVCSEQDYYSIAEMIEHG